MYMTLQYIVYVHAASYWIHPICNHPISTLHALLPLSPPASVLLGHTRYTSDMPCIISQCCRVVFLVQALFPGSIFLTLSCSDVAAALKTTPRAAHGQYTALFTCPAMDMPGGPAPRWRLTLEPWCVGVSRGDVGQCRTVSGQCQTSVS